MAQFQNDRQNLTAWDGQEDRKCIGRDHITKTEKKAESAGNINAYIYLTMDAQLNIQNGAFVPAIY